MSGFLHLRHKSKFNLPMLVEVLYPAVWQSRRAEGVQKRCSFKPLKSRLASLTSSALYVFFVPTQLKFQLCLECGSMITRDERDLLKAQYLLRQRFAKNKQKKTVKALSY